MTNEDNLAGWAGRPEPESPGDPRADGQEPRGETAGEDVDAELERRLHHERRVAVEMDQLRVRDDARRRLTLEKQGGTARPEILTLRERLARPRPPQRWRIRDWQPLGSRVMLSAAFKAGKTTLSGNAARCLVDGDPWLGRYDVEPIDGALGILDFEMSADQLDDWLRDQRIGNDDRVIPIPMRGHAATFNILDADIRAHWAKTLRERGMSYLILDCVRPVLDALGLSEDKEAGVFLTHFDMLLTEAAIPDALAVHHMGHTGERSRGDSRLRDWPDVEWRLVREDPDDPHSMRYVSAYGRDVDIPEGQLAYSADTRRLTLAGGSRKDAKASAALGDVLAALDQAGEPLTGKAIELALTHSEHTRDAVRRAVKLGIRIEAIHTQPGSRGAVMHQRAQTGQISSPARSPESTQPTLDTSPDTTDHETAGQEASSPARRSSPDLAGEVGVSAPAPLYRGALTGDVGANTTEQMATRNQRRSS